MQRVAKGFLTVALALGVICLFPGLAFSTNHQISIINFAFNPHGSHIIEGDTVTWTNHDNVQHSSTSDNGVWNTGLLSTGQSGSFIFVNPGTFPYHCMVHTSIKDTIFVSPLSGIGDPGLTIPEKFELSQNYPNPFNASTTIKFSLNESGRVKLEVYDILGNKIDQLANGNFGPGFYSYIWNGGQKTSGVYFYRLSLDNVTKTGRMTLLK